MGQSDDSWNHHQLLVLHELRRLSQAVEDLNATQVEQTLALEGLKIKSGLIATMAAIISAVGFDLGKYLYNK